jgi:hypothetical protein
MMETAIVSEMVGANSIFKQLITQEGFTDATKF